MKDLLMFSNVALGPSLPRSSPAVLYNLSSLSTICNTCTRVFVELFVTVENKRLVNQTPKWKVARWNRARAALMFPHRDCGSGKAAAT
jgi:hypothetical protein